jgi:hypothetical protein
VHFDLGMAMHYDLELSLHCDLEMAVHCDLEMVLDFDLGMAMDYDLGMQPLWTKISFRLQSHLETRLIPNPRAQNNFNVTSFRRKQISQNFIVGTDH